ncbi:unnamed protein product [Macrosiphum euphorbiae]|uniref:Uncharacterized protein n=1 Tax=Macrosiphum euphorbiae TaxID=13131 RepID=A0AAV0VGQ6_9HEMI|nr:unnamed protein product [Macrosiphum euphorbiae]
MLSKKRKYEEAHRAFNTDWEEEFAFIERNGKPTCLLCQVTLSQFKASNLKRHHDRNRSSFNKDFPFGSKSGKTKLKSLKEKPVTVSSPITNSTAVGELQLLELQEDEGLKGLKRVGFLP